MPPYSERHPSSFTTAINPRLYRTMSNLTTSIQLTKQSKYKLNNGLQIPVAGFGVCDIPVEQTQHLVYEALVAGYRHIDSAVGYHNQAETARGIREFLDNNPKVHREDIWFTSKIRNEDQGYELTKKSVQDIADEVKQHIGYVDLILIHSPKTSKKLRLETYEALQEFVLDASHPVIHVRSLGVSNYGAAHLEELFHWDGYLVKPVLNQLELHPWLPRLELRKYLVEKDIIVEAFSPLTQGVKLNDPELLELSKKSGINKVEILLKWSFLQGFVVLAKTVTASRIKQNLDILPDGNVGDELDETTNYGKVDLDLDVLEALDKPDSKEVMTWGGVDPTLYEDPQ